MAIDHRIHPNGPARRGALILRTCGWALAVALVFLLPPLASADALDLLQDNTDGTVGTYLKEVDGAVREAFNEATIFEGASTNKTMGLRTSR